jgi:hypothetical protein
MEHLVTMVMLALNMILVITEIVLVATPSSVMLWINVTMLVNAILPLELVPILNWLIILFVMTETPVLRPMFAEADLVMVKIL